LFNKKEYSKKYYQEHKKRSRELKRQWNINNPERYKASYTETPEKKEYRRRRLIKKRYGLSYKDWEGLWYSQDGRCAICDKFFIETKDICVDHDHKTGKVRSLLCKRCNIGIGLFEDNRKLLKSTVEYLKY